jgi:hypothetical protein
MLKFGQNGFLMCPKRATLACNYPMMNSKDGDKPKWQKQAIGQ